MADAFRRAIVFVDWDTARRVVPEDRVPISDEKRAARQIERVFGRLQQIVAEHLQHIDRRAVFRVRWRLYHGWLAGKTKTSDYRAVERYLKDASSITIGRVSFGVDIEVAYRLLAGGKRMPLYDSLRNIEEPDGTRVTRQKMVDTGLTSDLLYSARSSAGDVHLVIGDDDDLLPALFTAEAWGLAPHMYRLDEGSRHLNTKGIVSLIHRQEA